jgi:hypothetical protein
MLSFIYNHGSERNNTHSENCPGSFVKAADWVVGDGFETERT